MPDVLATDFRGATPAGFAINGTTVSQLGGDLHREATEGDGLGAIWRHDDNRLLKFWGKAFLWHNQRIYEFDSDAFYVTVGSYSSTQAAFHAFAAGDTWSASGGASGTFAEDGVSTDAFVILLVSSGTVGSGETITITSGTANNETADSTAAQTQGGALGYEGEWKTVHTLTATLSSALSHTGLTAGPVGNVMKAFGVFLDDTATPEFGSIVYNPVADTWTETTGIGVAPASSSNEFGPTRLVFGSLWGPLEGNSGAAGVMYWFEYSPTSDSVTVSSKTVTAASSEPYRSNLGSNVISWKGRIFSIVSHPTGSGTLELVEFSGGTWSQVWQSTGNASFPMPIGNANFPDSHGKKLFVAGDSLYGLVMGCNAVGATNRGWYALKWVIVGGSVFSDTMPSSVFAATSNDLALFLLPSSLAITSATLVAHNNRWRVTFDTVTNDPDGAVKHILYNVGDPTGGSAGGYQFPGLETLSDVTYTWDGTTTVVISGASSVAVGDWIGAPGDNEQLFQVSAVDPGVDITILNTQSLTIPTSTGDAISLQPFTSVGNISGSSEYAFSEDDRGGGMRVFTPGEKAVDIESIVKSVASEEIRYRAFGGGSVDIEPFYSSQENGKPDTQATASNPSEGSLSGGVITGVTADGAQKTFIWETSTDGVSSTQRSLLLKISV